MHIHKKNKKQKLNAQFTLQTDFKNYGILKNG